MTTRRLFLSSLVVAPLLRLMPKPAVKPRLVTITIRANKQAWDREIALLVKELDRRVREHGLRYVKPEA